MKALPPVLVVADRGRVLAFRTNESGSLHAFAPSEIPEGHQKISDIVTDQAGAFPVSGTNGTSAGEKMSLTAELEVRSFRRIAEVIRTILDGNPGGWGFAAPSEINGAILDFVGKPYTERLSLNLKSDLVNQPVKSLEARFTAARAAQIPQPL